MNYGSMHAEGLSFYSTLPPSQLQLNMMMEEEEKERDNEDEDNNSNNNIPMYLCVCIYMSASTTDVFMYLMAINNFPDCEIRGREGSREG